MSRLIFKVLSFELEHEGEGQYFPNSMFFLVGKGTDSSSAHSCLSLPKKLCYIGKEMGCAEGKAVKEVGIIK